MEAKAINGNQVKRFSFLIYNAFEKLLQMIKTISVYFMYV